MESAADVAEVGSADAPVEVVPAAVAGVFRWYCSSCCI